MGFSIKWSFGGPFPPPAVVTSLSRVTRGSIPVQRLQELVAPRGGKGRRSANTTATCCRRSRCRCCRRRSRRCRGGRAVSIASCRECCRRRQGRSRLDRQAHHLVHLFTLELVRRRWGWGWGGGGHGGEGGGTVGVVVIVLALTHHPNLVLRGRIRSGVERGVPWGAVGRRVSVQRFTRVAVLKDLVCGFDKTAETDGISRR